MNITLRQLRAFVAVAQTGSFTLAAERLYVTQSALSGLIKEMESSLGVRLFDRSTRRIELTPVGQELNPLIDKILHDLDGVLDEVTQLKALSKGLVRVAAPQLMACTLLPDIIASFRERHPGVRVQLIDCGVESVVSRVFTGEVDLGVGPERDPNSDILATPLFERSFYAVYPPGHPLAELPEIRWADLARYPLITLQGQFTKGLSTDLRYQVSGLDFGSSTVVNYMTTAFSMVAAGLGVTVCIPYAASLVRLYQFEMRPVVAPTIPRSFYVFTRDRRALSPAAQRFHDELFRYIEQHPDFQTN